MGAPYQSNQDFPLQVELVFPLNEANIFYKNEAKMKIRKKFRAMDNFWIPVILPGKNTNGIIR